MILRCLGGRGYSERDPRWSKDDPFLIGADVSLVIIPLFCDWWRLKWCSLSRAFKYILVYRFFILSSGPSDAASEIRQLGRGALYYWPRCSLSRTHAFDELLWKIREREEDTKKNLLLMQAVRLLSYLWSICIVTGRNLSSARH